MKYINLLLSVLTIIIGSHLQCWASPDTCHESSKYIVVEQGKEEDAMNYLVTSKSNQIGASCKNPPKNKDFEIENEGAECFLAIVDNLLILDPGTGPDPRDLSIWNLDSRKEVFSGSYSSPYEIHTGFMNYWLETGAANQKNCPKLKELAAGGLGAAIETKVRLNLANFS